ncbi:MAG: HAD hydrolase-like protein [Cephaloticoccus sp.]|nr:HAD hydrolase-like protein [Cephaloticoccus sp.]MCF7761966.1 HAD hydrolase-like protein [Cephaloticoccus sp.]
MIVFDVDGTLIGGESNDWASFEAAFLTVAGFALDKAFFARIEEITAQAIVHQALAELPLAERKTKESAVRHAYVQNLQVARDNDAAAFPAADGARSLLQELRAQGIPVAIATGDWRESILIKLQAAGIEIEGIPLVTSSDFYSRADIIAAAVTQAGHTLDEAIYVGDGPWDLRACRKLGIPFIGVGRRRDRLQAAGAIHLLTDFSPSEFLRTRAVAMSPG